MFQNYRKLGITNSLILGKIKIRDVERGPSEVYQFVSARSQVLTAELWVLYQGLVMAWNYGVC